MCIYIYKLPHPTRVKNGKAKSVRRELVSNWILLVAFTVRARLKGRVGETGNGGQQC